MRRHWLLSALGRSARPFVGLVSVCHWLDCKPQRLTENTVGLDTQCAPSYNSGMSDSAPKAPNCLACSHYKVSWDRNFPHFCNQFGIKSRAMPSLEVFRATGKQCPVFMKNPLYH